MSRFIVFCVFMGVCPLSVADLIDGYGASQGPMTVGPGEEVAEADAALDTSSVLGGFRLLVPALDEEAPAGSTVMAGVAGGMLTCSVDISQPGVATGGGCSSGYGIGDGQLFDLSGSSAFELDIESVTGPTEIVVMVFGPDESSFAAVLESPSAGSVTLPFSHFVPLTPTAPEWDEIEVILVTTATTGGGSGKAALGRFATNGPIAGADPVDDDETEPDPGPDSQLRAEISGNYFNIARSGEGLQLTLENDGETFILTYYTYLDGKQVWLIGVGQLDDGRIVFDDMSITEGAGYGDAFDSDDVSVTPWGRITMIFADCNNAIVEVSSELESFESFTVDMSRIVPTQCGAGGPDPAARTVIGNYFGPARSGEGFQLAYEEGRYILTFYTYLDGEQVWMIGVGDRSGNRFEFPEVFVTEGADFGGRFRSGDVTNILFGEINLVLDDCNHATVEVLPELPGFHAQTLEVEKIVSGPCEP